MYSDSQTPTEQKLGFSLDIPAKSISGYRVGEMVMDAKMEGKGIAEATGEKQVDPGEGTRHHVHCLCPLPVKIFFGFGL